MTLPADELPLIDHHCHGIVRRDLERAEFESLLCEADGPGRWHGTLFDTQVGLAVRRLCAPLLDLPPHADPDDYLARRLELGWDEVSRRLLAPTGIVDFLVDTGLTPDELTSPGELADYAGGRGHEVVRLERLAEQVITRSDPADYAEDFAAALAERAADAVGLKSIAAYRCGLDLAPERPAAVDVARAAHRWAAGIDDRTPPRLVDQTLIRHGIWTGVDLGLPVQFHVGYGDSDAELRRGDPLLLMPLLRATRDAGVPILLLHNYPFHRHAGLLAQVFDHVFVDVGLALHNVGTRAGAVLAELLELAPFGSVLFSTDAYGLPELYLVNVTLFRSALGAFLSDGVHREFWTSADADRLAAAVCSGNARRAYALGED